MKQNNMEEIDENYIKLGHIIQILKDKNDHLFKYKIKTIIESGFDINYKLSFKSFICQNKPQYIGNTVLHFAADLRYNDLDLFNFLIENGADFTIKNDNGYTPLLLAFNNDYAIKSLLSSHVKRNISTNSTCKNGISHFHVACSTDQVDVVDFFLKTGISVDEQVNNDSPKYPGFTPLHFAIQNWQTQTMELLLDNGAKFYSKDAKGVTPLHLLIKNLFNDNYDDFYKTELIRKAIPTNSVKLSKDMDLPHLIICVLCILFKYENIDQFYKQDTSIDSFIPFNSPVWPGYTPLHFAVNLDLQIVISMLEKGADILVKDATNTTPLDLCLKKFNPRGLVQILSAEKRHKISKLKFTYGTYLLDVIGALTNSYLFDEFVMLKVKNVNMFLPFDSVIWPGNTLLHLIAIFASDNNDLNAHCLLSRKANFTMQNAQSMSPLHLAFHMQNEKLVKAILNTHKEICTNPVNQDDLSHLHIACVEGHFEAVEFLLIHGADPNLKSVLRDYQGISRNYQIKTGSTPLHIAIKNLNYNVVQILLSYGANIFANDADGITPFQIIWDLNYKDVGLSASDYVKFIHLIMKGITKFNGASAIAMSLRVLKKTFVTDFKSIFFQRFFLEFFKNKLHKKLGLTRLEIACIIGDMSMIQEELKSGMDINHRISLDSPIWPGSTALHISLHQDPRLKTDIVIQLLEYGADPTIKDANNLTPIHLSGIMYLEKVISIFKNKFTRINPFNNDGLSHFHLCCKTNNLLVIQEFIKSGIDVNTPVDYFADNYAGYTPLHFAADYGSKEIVDLLLRHGADPNNRTTSGFTPLHLAAILENNNLEKVKSLLRFVDIQELNVFGETVLEVVLNTPHPNEEIINLFLRKGIHLDFSKFTAEKPFEQKIINNAACKLSTETFRRLIENVTNITDVDDEGQNAIHLIFNAQTLCYCRYNSSCNLFNNLIELIEYGCELDHKDNKGRTALHKVSLPNIHILLSLGPDINIKNDDGKTPYEVILKDFVDETWEIQQFYSVYVKTLEILGLYVDESNKFNTSVHPHLEEIEKEKRYFDVISSDFSADYFFSEKFIIDYKRMPVSQRLTICNLYNSDDFFDQFYHLVSYIRLQIRRARARTRLLEPAQIAFEELADIYLPEPCIESIFNNLNNEDLMNLVRAYNGKLVFSSLPKNC